MTNAAWLTVAGVAHILMDEGDVTDIEVLQAAILHDTVEDTDTTLDEIQDVFGEKVRKLLTVYTYSAKGIQTFTFRKMFY